MRSRSVDEASSALRAAGQSARAAEEAARAAAEEAGKTRHHEQATRQREASELQSARDFSQLAAFDLGAERRIAAADERARASASRASEAHSLEDRARTGLIEARAALDVVERHQRDARVAAERKTESATDEAAEEAFAARFRRPV